MILVLGIGDVAPKGPEIQTETRVEVRTESRNYNSGNKSMRRNGRRGFHPFGALRIFKGRGGSCGRGGCG